MPKARFTDEEKLKIIEQAKASGNIFATAKQYSVSDGTIHGWIKKFNKTSNKSLQKDLNQEIKALKRQLADKELECAILKDLVKKTVQVWSHDDKSPMNTSPGNLLKTRF
ncbi:MAG: hypothetical protein OHK0056_25210 [Bacteriovoracaceae bacterium]